MSARHVSCGGVLSWKALVDDGGEPCLLPWCGGCRVVVGTAETLGEAREIPVTVEAVAEARVLAAALVERGVVH